MSFALAGAFMGAGGALSEWAADKRKEIAAAKEREGRLADAKELFDYKMDRKEAALSRAGGGGGKGGKGKGGSGSGLDAAMAGLGPVGKGAKLTTSDWKLLGTQFDDDVLQSEQGKKMYREAATQMSNIKAAAGKDATPQEIMNLTMDSMVKDDNGEYLGFEPVDALLNKPGSRSIKDAPPVPSGQPSAPTMPSGGFDQVMLPGMSNDQAPAGRQGPTGAPSANTGGGTAATIAKAQAAVNAGADIQAVRARLQAADIDPNAVKPK